jgi:hypothetical protein
VSPVGAGLHLVAADLQRGDVRYSVLGAGGPRRADDSIPLPLAHATGLCAGPASLLVAGAAAGSEVPVVLGLDGDGTVRQRTPLPVAGPLLRWPTPLRLAEHDVAVWEEYAGDGTAVVMCRIPPDEVAGVARHQFPVFGDQTAVAVVDDDIVMARVDPQSREVLVSRLDQDLRTVSRRAVTEHADAVALSSTDRGAVVAWIHGGRRVQVRLLSPDLTPMGSTLTVAEVDAPATVTGLRLAASGGFVALIHRTRTLEERRGLRREAVTLVDLPAEAITGLVWLDPPSAGAATAAWLGTEVWVLHGTGGVITRIVR